jgi:hypothetical protein
MLIQKKQPKNYTFLRFFSNNLLYCYFVSKRKEVAAEVQRCKNDKAYDNCRNCTFLLLFCASTICCRAWNREFNQFLHDMRKKLMCFERKIFTWSLLILEFSLGGTKQKILHALKEKFSLGPLCCLNFFPRGTK